MRDPRRRFSPRASFLHGAILWLGPAIAIASTLTSPCTPTLRPGTLSPTSIDVSFDNKIAFTRHHVTVAADFPRARNASQRAHLYSTGCYDLVLFFGDHDGSTEVLERSLPSGVGSVCRQRDGHVVIDDTYDESYALSCCMPMNDSCASSSSLRPPGIVEQANSQSFTCPFKCPIPAADLVAPDNVAVWDRIAGWTVSIHATSRERHAQWSYLNEDSPDPLEFRFIPESTGFGMANMLMTICIFVPVITGAISGTTDRLHAIAGSTPYLSFAAHLLSTVMMTVILAYLLSLVLLSGDVSDRGLLMRSGLVYALISVTFSPLILYTPKPKEQTIHVDKETLSKTCGEGKILKCTRWCKQKKVRNFCAFMYCLGFFLQALSIYSIYHALRQHAAAEMELCFTVSVVYVVLVIVYLVAFITAIYDLRPVLRIDYMSGQLTKAYPHSLRSMREKAKEITLKSSEQNASPQGSRSSVMPLGPATNKLIVKQSNSTEERKVKGPRGLPHSKSRSDSIVPSRILHQKKANSLDNLWRRRKLWLYSQNSGFIDVDRWLVDAQRNVREQTGHAKAENKFGRAEMILRAPELDLQEGSLVVLKSLIVDPGLPGDYKKIAESMGIGPLCDICCWTVGTIKQGSKDFEIFEEDEAAARDLKNFGKGAPRFICSDWFFPSCLHRFKCCPAFSCCMYQAIGTHVELPCGNGFDLEEKLAVGDPKLNVFEPASKSPQKMALRQPPKKMVLDNPMCQSDSETSPVRNPSNPNQQVEWCPTSGILYVVKKYDKDTFRFLEVGTIEDGVATKRRNFCLNVISLIFAFRDGDAIDPTVDWQPNLVESMRVQGWVSFDSIRCLRGSRCAYFYFSSLLALALVWWGMILYFLAIALQKNHGGLVVMLVSFVGVLELVLVSVLTVFGYIVSTDVEDNEDPMTNPKLKVVKMSYDRYICGGWFLDRDNYGGNGRQTPRFSAPPFGSAQSRLREQKSLPRATLSLPLSPDEEHEGSTSSLNHSSGSDRLQGLPKYQQGVAHRPRKIVKSTTHHAGENKSTNNLSETTDAFAPLPDVALPRGPGQILVQVHPSLPEWAQFRNTDESRLGSENMQMAKPDNCTFSAKDSLDFDVNFDTGIHSIIPAGSSSGVAWAAAVCHRDIVNEMASRRNNDSTRAALPEAELKEVGAFRGVASCNSFPIPDQNDDPFTSKTMATILLRPGSLSEPPLFPVDDGAEERNKPFGTDAFIFTAEIPRRLLEHDDNALVSFGVVSENFKCNFFPGANDANSSFPKDTSAAAVGAYIRRHTQDGKEEWIVSAGVSGGTGHQSNLTDRLNILRLSKESWKSDISRVVRGHLVSTRHKQVDRITVGCGLMKDQFFIVLPNGAYTFPQKWRDIDGDGGEPVPGLYDFSDDRRLNLFGQDAHPAQILLSVRGNPKADPNMRNINIKLALQRVSLSRLDSHRLECEQDPWTHIVSPLLDLSITETLFAGSVRSQTTYSSSEIVFKGKHVTPMLVRKEGHVDNGHIIHISTGSREKVDEDLEDTDFVSPLTSWSTSLKGLSIPNSILNLQSSAIDSINGSAEAKSTPPRTMYPHLECIYKDKHAVQLLPSRITFVVPTCVMSRDRDAQFCQFDIDLSANQWVPGLMAFGLISLDDYYSHKPRDTCVKPNSWPEHMLLEQLNNLDEFPIKLLNPGNSTKHTSMGFHSDDGSFVTNCFTKQNKDIGSIHKATELKWLEKYNSITMQSIHSDSRQYSFGVGYDGSSVFIVHPGGKKIRFESFMVTDSWKNGSAFVPILMVDECQSYWDMPPMHTTEPATSDSLGVVMRLKISASIDKNLQEIFESSTATN